MSLQNSSALDTSSQTQTAPQPEGHGAESLAARALSLVASRKLHGREGDKPLCDAPWPQRMAEAAVDAEPSRLTGLAHEMRAARVPIEAIIDAAIPEAARLLGQYWVEDRIGFSSTSIGTARLQGLLRDLMRTGTAPLIAGLSEAQPAVLVVVPEGEQHTLGALVASAQLMRAGFDTVLSLCESPARLRMRLKADRFAAVCLSISRVETLASAGNLVEIIRQGSNHPVKVMVGGAAIGNTESVECGADAVTNDLSEALRLCGLKISTPVAGRGATRA